ncbi:hypothetical protein L6164_010379 [Bauhinia variegata]|uniref:Uncharacterized protein n=1 Tax=Bauhinia variegata TaxID=167791 RepID=A0ACB9PMR1_BAUVA|nr:hypothetical protein L6164_010379 [Bauhinia variegata]
MHAFPLSSESYLYPAFHFLQAPPCIYFNHSYSLFSDPFNCKIIPQIHQSFPSAASPKLFSSSSKLRPFVYCTSESDSTTNLTSFDVDEEGDEEVNSLLVAGELEEPKESITEDGVYIQVKKLEKNSRRIESRISIDAPLISVWKILTDYERLADFIPGLAVSQLLEKGDNYARLYQVCHYNVLLLYFYVFNPPILNWLQSWNAVYVVILMKLDACNM